jgi:hypothetical protein
VERVLIGMSFFPPLKRRGADDFSVNMYASTWICTKTVEVYASPEVLSKVGTAGTLEELHI